MFEPDKVSQSVDPAQPSDLTSLSAVPLIPRELEALNLNPDKTLAIPTFINIEEVRAEDVLALIEKLEFPIDSDGLEQIDRILRKSINELKPSSFMNAQIDGCPVSVLFTQNFRVGDGKYRELRTVEISPEDLTAPIPHVKLFLDTVNAELGTFNVTLNYDIDQIYALQLEKTVWNELNSFLDIVGSNPLPKTLEKTDRLCAQDNNGQLCVVATINHNVTLGMLPLEVRETANQNTQCEPAPAATRDTEKTVLDRMPHTIYINKPDIDELRFIVREFNQGNHSELSVFDEAYGDSSFLSNALRLVNEDADADLNIWTMNKFENPLMIFIHRSLTIGDSEYGIERSFTAIASNIVDDEDQEYSAENERDDLDEDDDQDDDFYDPTAFGPMSGAQPPDISITQQSDEHDISIAISKDNGIFCEDGNCSEKSTVAVISFGPTVTQEQRWALIDRMTLHFDQTQLSADPNHHQIPANGYFYSLERVGIQLYPVD